MALNSPDVQKILTAGFTIIRGDQQRLAIKKKSKERREWHDLKKDFPSKAAMRRSMDELLISSKVIED